MTIRWYGLLAPEEAPTGDRRMFATDALTYRNFPLPLAWQRTSSSGHSGSVIVGSWTRQYKGDGGVWGSGEFLDPSIVPEVTEAAYLLDKRLIGPSVDLDPDMAYEIVDHPTQPGEFAMKVTRGNVHGVTLVMSPAFPQVHITVDTSNEMDVLTAAGISATFASSGVNSSSWSKFPLAPRETKFNFETATDNIAAWSNGDPKKFASGFLWQDPDGNPLNRETYRLPIIDILNGKPYLIPAAVFSAGVIMSGGHGGLYDTLDTEQRLEVQNVITDIYDMLRDEYADPRVTAPWQKGGRQGARNEADEPTRVASLETDMISEELDAYILSRMASVLNEFAVRSSGWSSLPTSEAPWDEGAARRALDAWAGDDMAKYGRAFLYSDGSGNKTGFKFPIAMPVNGKLTIFLHAVNNAKSRLSSANIPAADKSRIDSILTTIQKRYSGGDEQAAVNEQADAEFQSRLGGELERYWTRGEGAAKIRWGTPGDFNRCVRQLTEHFPQDPKGLCANLHHEALGVWPGREHGGSGEHTLLADTLTADGMLKPERTVFDNPQFKRATPLVVTEDGRVYGHLATWKQCHMGVGNKCVIAPQSKTDYKWFKTGSVMCADGSTLRVGKITIGTGHADKKFGIIPATEHYDDTGTCVAVVNAGEDRFGPWVAGALVAGVTPERVAELRRSPLSGDWRRVDGNLELVAALAVNNPGFPVLDEDGDGAYSLVAAGVLSELGGQDSVGVPDTIPEVDARFSDIDRFIADHNRMERVSMLRDAFQDLPPQEGCGCDV